MIYPNKKYRTGSLEITCYGERLIMVDHPALSAPLPVGPTDKSEFWAKAPADRLAVVLDYIEEGLTAESDPAALLAIFEDIDRARAEIENSAADELADRTGRDRAEFEYDGDTSE